jgi:hypothetical protein
MEFYITISIVGLLGCLVGFAELIARYADSKYILKTWQSYAYILVNGIISIGALFLIWHFRNTDLNSIKKIEINNIIIAGLGGMIILRSSFFTIKHNEAKIDIGFGIIAQVFLDLIERKMKNKAGALKIDEMNEIMGGVNFDEAKDELSTLCYRSIDNFSKEDSDTLIMKIEEISKLELGNINKVIQLGMCISKYCDNETLKKSINVLGLKEKEKTIKFANAETSGNIEFFIQKLKKS